MRSSSRTLDGCLDQLVGKDRQEGNRQAGDQAHAGIGLAERGLVQLILAGHPSVNIAERLGITVGTVKNHRRRIYEKLDITTERELFLRFFQHRTETQPAKQRVGLARFSTNCLTTAPLANEDRPAGSIRAKLAHAA